MPKAKKNVEPPAITPEARENQLISLAINCAEEQLRNGTASSQVITHYLKLGSLREQQERKLQEKKMALMDAKIEAIKSPDKMEKLCHDAIEAMKRYSGASGDD